jgi:hypothetical protein
MAGEDLRKGSDESAEFPISVKEVVAMFWAMLTGNVAILRNVEGLVDLANIRRPRWAQERRSRGGLDLGSAPGCDRRVTRRGGGLSPRAGADY